MTRSIQFGLADELLILRGIIALPSDALQRSDVIELLDVIRGMRLQRACGERPIRFTREDRRVLAWLIDELGRNDDADPLARALTGLLWRVAAAIEAHDVEQYQALAGQQRVDGRIA